MKPVGPQFQCCLRLRGCDLGQITPIFPDLSFFTEGDCRLLLLCPAAERGWLQTTSNSAWAQRQSLSPQTLAGYR